MGGPDATANLWKQLFSAVRASGGYPGNAAEEDNLSPFDSISLPCRQCIKINTNKHVCMYGMVWYGTYVCAYVKLYKIPKWFSYISAISATEIIIMRYSNDFFLCISFYSCSHYYKISITVLKPEYLGITMYISWLRMDVSLHHRVISNHDIDYMMTSSNGNTGIVMGRADWNTVTLQLLLICVGTNAASITLDAFRY